MDVEIKNLIKSYGPQRAVDNINFQVKTGEILGFLGPNGAGKSTTMKMITGYLGIEGGSIHIGGRSVSDDLGEIRKHIGYLPENNPLYLDMPIVEYLEYCAALQGIPKHMVGERIREMIAVCGLNREKHKKIGELSKGYRQRVGLAQAMIHDPAVLILDEPTTGLDPNQIVEIRKLIRDLGKEKTVVLSTHILPEVEATCDRILIINRGRIVADGTSETLREIVQGGEKLKIRVESDGEDPHLILNTLKQLPEILDIQFFGRDKTYLEVHSQSGESSKKAIFKACVDNGWMLTETIPLETKLEDIFINLTK